MHKAGASNRLKSHSLAVRERSSRPTSGAVSVYGPAALLLLAGLTGLSAAWIMSGSGSGRYLVIASPGASRAQTIDLVRSAEGGLIGMGRFSNMIIAGSNRPNFAAALRKAGAWAVIAMPVRRGCGEPLSVGQTI
ncbi:hypothetical protein [Sphingobium sp.]|uniref:hypothetical protein n=1 Tax=Sphingobium sp. TaxID=1912891 RepID=UPI0035C68D10